MALITKFSEIHKDANRAHGEVECGYTAFTANGRRYLQLDTYGSPDRTIPGKISQSIQLDESAAAKLVELIRRTFPSVS